MCGCVDALAHTCITAHVFMFVCVCELVYRVRVCASWNICICVCTCSQMCLCIACVAVCVCVCVCMCVCVCFPPHCHHVIELLRFRQGTVSGIFLAAGRRCTGLATSPANLHLLT